jgi:hypothetical protein
MSNRIEHSREEWDRINAERRKAEDEAYAKRKAKGEVPGSQTSHQLALPDPDDIRPHRSIPEEEIAEVKRLHLDVISTPLKIFRLGELLERQLELIPHGDKEKWFEQTYPEIGLTTIRLWIRIARQRSRLETKFPIIRQQLPISSWTKTDLDLLPSVRQMRDATMEFEAEEREASRPIMDLIAEDSARKVGEQLMAEVELKQEEEVGITYEAAKKKVFRSWERITRGENEKAVRHLAYVFVDYLFKLFPDLQDKPFEEDGNEGN